jgi:hypothetical protein
VCVCVCVCVCVYIYIYIIYIYIYGAGVVTASDLPLLETQSRGTHSQKVLSIVHFYSTHTKAPTFENILQATSMGGGFMMNKRFSRNAPVLR